METLSATLPYVQMILAALLGAGILMQRSDASLGEAFGGVDSGLAGHTRRGGERVIFEATVILAILFAGSAIFALVIR